MTDGERPVLAVLSLMQPRLPEGQLELFALEGGTWTPLGRWPAGSRPQSLAVGDVDGDGIDELFIPAQNGHRVHAFHFRAEAGEPPRAVRRFEPLDSLGAHLGCLDALALDLDGDGDDELVVANGFSDDLSVIRRQ